MTRLILTVVLVGSVAILVPYVLARRTSERGRALLAYAMGALASALTSLGVFLATHAILPTPALGADGIVGSGLLCAVVGPALGVVAGKRVRRRARARL